jgi:hypothetical protein
MTGGAGGADLRELKPKTGSPRTIGPPRFRGNKNEEEVTLD